MKKYAFTFVSMNTLYIIQNLSRKHGDSLITRNLIVLGTIENNGLFISCKKELSKYHKINLFKIDV